jgi:RNA polymerase sigma-70 factor (ECF subfamily)
MSILDSVSTHQSLLYALGQPHGREQAWRTFLGRYEPLLYHWCQRWGVPPTHREEVSATVVARLFEGLHRYDPSHGPFRPWLKTVAIQLWRSNWTQTLSGRPPR